MSKVRSINDTLLFPPEHKFVLAAAGLIRRGRLVAFPTETVYGLGANALERGAVGRIFRAKGRPPDKPLIVHVAEPEQVEEIAASIPHSAHVLMERFWPGPLSLVLPRSAVLPQEVSAGLPTVAVRMPAHPLALGLIRAAAVPIAAPSANLSGRPSPTRLHHVLQDLAGRIDAVLDGGSCPVGVESTVLDLSRARPTILRSGGITREQLEDVLGVEIGSRSAGKRAVLPGEPGRQQQPYVFRTPLILLTGPVQRRRQMLRSLAAGYRRKGLKVGVVQMPRKTGGLEQAASELFPQLRRLDAQGLALILAESAPPGGLGEAITDRLRRAASRIIRV